MEQPSITYSSIQFVDHDSTHGISSHEDDNCQEKLSEDGQKRQEKLSKSSSYFKQPSQEVTQQSQRSQRKW
ncbi:hypothetical protein RclHR1_00820009 [Rhizophagus clarus]|uniref:Uncharacterized protein n=1 Tax=Rhizophagus clarus TaxID=94130 RepID=A0A2Z6SFB8_9GLOM|nr:hypothetical protein RclHR1_00820009 [Rhizophagus clarus]